jgi:hypothetical protein
LVDGVPESHSLFALADGLERIANASPAAGLCRRTVLSHPSRGAIGLRDCSVAVEPECALESELVGFDAAWDVVPGRSFARHHYQRGYGSDFSSAVAV